MGKIIMIIKKFEDELKRLTDQFIVQSLIKIGDHGIFVSRDGKTFYVYSKNIVIFKTNKISEAIKHLQNIMGKNKNK